MGSLVLWASVAVIAALAGAVALYLILAWLLGVPPHPKAPTADQQELLADVVKIALGLAAGIGAAVALIVGYRRARVDESASHRDDQRLFSSRYQDAADLIGHDKAAVRLAGIYAMSRLADDWDEQRQQCIDVLCAYLRLPYNPADTNKPGEQQVRDTVIRIITAHLQPMARVQWQGHDLDFTGAVFDGGDFSGAVFSSGSVNFNGAQFSDGLVNFSDTVFSGSYVTFRTTKFSGGVILFKDAEFASRRAKSSGGIVDFEHAVFSGGAVYFGNAKFSGGTVTFKSAKFSGSVVGFGDAVFSGGDIDFGNAKFSGGTVTFKSAKFSGSTVHFSDAKFSGGEVDLSAADLHANGPAPQGLPEAPIPSLKLPGWLKQT